MSRRRDAGATNISVHINEWSRKKLLHSFIFGRLIVPAEREIVGLVWNTRDPNTYMKTRRFQEGERVVQHLATAISVYEAALGTLPSRRTSDAEIRVLTTLLARDDLAHCLSSAHPVAAGDLSHITDLDQRLQARAPAIVAIVGHVRLVNWRETAEPPVSAWWWYLDERAEASSAWRPILSGILLV